MKINSSNKVSKRVRNTLLVLFGLLLVGLIGFGIYKAINPSEATPNSPDQGNTINYNPPTNEEKQVSIDTKQQAINKQNDNAANANTRITVSITRAGQVGQVVSVRSFVDGTVSGKCNMTFVKSGQTAVIHEVDILFEATSSLCNADIDVSKFTEGGAWDLTVTAQKDGLISQPATSTVTISK